MPSRNNIRSIDLTESCPVTMYLTIGTNEANKTMSGGIGLRVWGAAELQVIITVFEQKECYKRTQARLNRVAWHI